MALGATAFHVFKGVLICTSTCYAASRQTECNNPMPGQWCLIVKWQHRYTSHRSSGSPTYEAPLHDFAYVCSWEC